MVGKGFSPREWRVAKRKVRTFLVKVARGQSTVFYKDVASFLNDTRVKPQSRAMREVLTEISMAEHAAGRPLLSAVVVRTDTRRPGKGFEAMAKLLRVRGRSSPQTFWKMQRDRVWKHVWT